MIRDRRRGRWPTSVAFRRTGLLVLGAVWWFWGPGPGLAADRTNVPLKNWGGFSVFRDSVYDDLERLVTSGVADRAVLNTKPLIRMEAARIVARAIENIRRDETGIYNTRRDLEPVLDRLRQELRIELAALGVKPSEGPAPGFLSFVPVDHAQLSAGLTNRDRSLINSQGRKLRSVLNGGATFDSRAQVGDFLSFYVQPELLGDGDTGAARLATGYAKLTLYNVELLVGRDSLWWGPALHGSLIFSNNGPPLDQIRVGAAEPFLLPWIGEWVGPTKLLVFLAQLETRRDHPRAKLAGMRGTITPFSFLELGVSRGFQFNGDDRPRLKVREYPRLFFEPSLGDDPEQDAKFRNNNLFAIDGDVRLRNVQRYLLPSRDLRLYGEFGWDDTCCSSSIVPLQRAASWLLGVQLLGILGSDTMEARFEYAQTSELSFVHTQFTNGWWSRGEVLSHFIGSDGFDYLARVTDWVTPGLMIGGQFNRSVIGNTRGGGSSVQEERLGIGVDISYRFSDTLSLWGAYEIMHVSNRNFKSGDDGFDHLLRFELTRSFR